MSSFVSRKMAMTLQPVFSRLPLIRCWWHRPGNDKRVRFHSVVKDHDQIGDEKDQVDDAMDEIGFGG